MKVLLTPASLTCGLFLVLSFLFGQSACVEAQIPHHEIHEQYERYREPVIKDRRFKHSDIVPIIEDLPTSLFEVKVAGQSIEGRDIYQIKVGTGPTKVLLWSQMHGNEPTATMALFDLFRFLSAEDDMDPLRDEILSGLTLYFIPMLNPDGAEQFARRNAISIDLNRDALRLTSPESRILKGVRDEVEPEWGFNLHDQNRFSAAGKNPQSASISFLAPAYNEAKDWDEKRMDAMQLIVGMNEVLQNYIPKKVGRYSDAFEPRAFGDNMQKWGTRTILIETGALHNDLEKQYLRQLNFVALLSAFAQIAEGSFEKYTLDQYEQIPFNSGALHDLIIRNATLVKEGQEYLIDIGFRSSESNTANNRNFVTSYQISDLGDLHNYYGYEEVNAEGMKIVPGKAYPQAFEDLSAFSTEEVIELLQDGYTTVRINNFVSREDEDIFPLEILQVSQKHQVNFDLGQSPSFLLSKDGEYVLAVTNGQVLDLNKPSIALPR